MRATVDRPGLDSQGRSPLIKIRRVRKGDLSKVRDVIEQAFGDFFERQVGTRPRQVFGGAQYVHHRWLMEPWGCFVAEEGDGKIVGAAVAVMWGTVGVIGPVAVLTHYQNQDIGQQLLTACQEFFDENKATLQGVATYPYSPKHLIFYQKYGYRPKGLVVVTSKPLDGERPPARKPAAKPGPRRAPVLHARGSAQEAGDAEDPAHHQSLLARARREQGDRDRRRSHPGRHAAPREGPRGDRLRGLPPAAQQRGAARHRLRQVAGDRRRHTKPEHLQALLASVEEMAARPSSSGSSRPSTPTTGPRTRRCSSAATTWTSRWSA